MSQSEDKREKAFLGHVKRVLDESADALDEDTLRKLRIARKEAVARHSPRQTWWQPLAGGAAVASLAVVIVVGSFWSGSGQDGVPVSGFDDLELLSSAEDIEFYEDLEFYQWLENEELAG